MARLHTGILVLCLFAFTCTAHAEIGTVRLQEDRLLFASPATTTETPNQYVKVICHADENFKSGKPSRTVTNDKIHPLLRASVGETLTILDVIRCGDTKNGAYVQARTVQHVVGYTQLPNYHTHVRMTDSAGDYRILFLRVPSCLAQENPQYPDPECRGSDFAAPFANYARQNPTSTGAKKAAEFAAAQYKYAADTFRYIAEHGGHPTLTSYTPRYTRPALITKANEYRALENQMQIGPAGGNV
jgi:hypothetical protein